MSKLDETFSDYSLRDACDSLNASGRLPHKLTLAGFALIAALTFAITGRAQTVAVRVQPVRITVADNTTGTFVLTNYVDLDSNVVSAVNLSISGLPAGVGASFGNTVFATDDGTTLTLGITNLAPGEHTVSLDAAGGAENHLFLTLQSGRMWTGDTNVATTWSSASSWVGGVPPGVSDDVLFTQLGAQTNVIVNSNFFANSIVDSDVTIASLRFSQTNNGNPRAGFHTVEIQPGRTLWVAGTNGLQMLRDSTGLAGQMDVNFAGLGGTLVVSNPAANVAITIDNQQAHRFDLSGLGTFVADVSRVGFGNYRMYPNYTNLVNGNNYGGNATFLMPRRFIPSIRLARTNIIRATHADPNNYLDPAIRDYSLTFENNDVGTTADGTLFFGITNAFFMDSLCLVQSSAQAEAANEIVFNPGFLRFTNIVGSVTNFITNQCVAYFRGTNGGRMSVFAVADAAGVGPSGTSTKALVDFRGGTVDALVDRLYMGRDRTNSSDNANGEAVMLLASGRFDVNTAILGFQGNGNNQNVGGNTPIGYARGTLSVNSSAVFVVNDTLEFGHTTADSGDRRQAEQGFGLLNITNGTVMANTITVGGVTKVSGNNRIIMRGGNLIVSNTIAGSDKSLSTLEMNGGAALTLHINGSQTTPYVYVTNLNVTTGQTNVLNIASVENLTVPPDGINVPIFQFVSGGANFSLVNLPAPMRGMLVPGAVANQIDLNIITNAPRDLIWRGYANASWDNSSSNWLDSATLQHVKFVSGDNVLFDDLGGVPTTVTLAAPIIAGAITVSNAVNFFTFMFVSDGSIIGGSLVKNGTGTLELDAPTSIGVQINEGTFTGNNSGSIAAASVAAGGTVIFSGSIASGVSCAGTATLMGDTAGTLTVQSPSGTLTNSGTVNGGFVTQSGTLLYNSGTLNNIGSSTVASNATLINAGNIGSQLVNGSVSVSGTFKDLGTGILTLDLLSINNRGTFIPGGDGIGSTIVASTALGNTPGRVTFANGSTNVFKVNPDIPTNTVLYSERTDFGPNQNTPSVNGGTIQIFNVGTPFASPSSIGQSFRLFRNSSSGNFGGNIGDSGLNTTNSYPIMLPAAPAPALVWDLFNLRNPDGSGQTGILAIRGVTDTPTNLIFAPFFTTVITTNSTNFSIVADLSWPTEYVGWRLEVQNSELTNGLRLGASNWSTLFGSVWTNRVVITNTINNNGSATFYRMAYP